MSHVRREVRDSGASTQTYAALLRQKGLTNSDDPTLHNRHYLNRRRDTQLNRELLLTVSGDLTNPYADFNSNSFLKHAKNSD